MFRFIIVNSILITAAVFTFGQQNSAALFPKQHLVAPFNNKPVIDSMAICNWFSLERGVAISYDGDYVIYHIKNYPVGDVTTIIQSVNGAWKKELIGIRGIQFSGDSKKAIYMKGNTLFFLPLGNVMPDSINGVRSFKIAKSQKIEWLAYQLNGNTNELVLLNLLSGKERRFQGVTDYLFDTEYAVDNDIVIGNIRGSILLMVKEDVSENVIQKKLQWVQLQDEQSYEIWSARVSSNVTPVIRGLQFDRNAEQIVFTVEDTSGNSIWYYKNGMSRAEAKITNKSPGIDELSVKGAAHFSSNGKWIFFILQARDDKKMSKSDGAMVNVWSYRDAVLQPEQLAKEGAISNTYENGPGVKRYMAVVSTQSNKIVRLERENEIMLISAKQVSTDFIVLRDNHYIKERWWSHSPRPSVYLVSLKDGSRRMLRKDNSLVRNFSFSPDGKYLVYYDLENGAYFSIELITGNVRNITQSLPEPVFENYTKSVFKSAVAPVAAWMETGDLLIYDNFDIWKIDLSGKRQAVNITGGYGKKNHVKLRLVTEDPDGRNLIFKRNEIVLLVGLNEQNKYNGFFRIKLDQKESPELLYSGPYTFYHKRSQVSYCYEFDEGMVPLKAGGRQKWLVQRQSASEAPNIFITNDFKSFARLTDIQPQKGYNWLTTELVTWKMLDGRMSQGILYKPENFDSTKKYPLIFNYYEKLSHRLYEFPAPQFATDNINIAWFVSRGYLVFTPDIYYKPANVSGKVVGEWAYNSVVSAARRLASVPYINAARMGIQGHSFGGLETNYLVTHTTLFAAAAAAAGATDPISEYLTLIPFLGDDKNIEDNSTQNKMEDNHELYGSTPWGRPELYKKNSSVLNADKVVTPLLIMHNRLDDQIQWRQGIELYMALRRLQKRVWLLAYDNGYHTVSGKDAIDYTIRLNQFFDHYLKDTPAPAWMTKGIPARLKGIEKGYELDTNESCGKGCKVCGRYTSTKKLAVTAEE